MYVFIRNKSNLFFILGKDSEDVENVIIPSCKTLNQILNKEIIIFSDIIGKYKKISFDDFESYIREQNNKDIIYIDYNNLFMESTIESDIESDFELDDNNNMNINKKMKELRIIDLFLNSLSIDKDLESNSLSELFSIIIVIDIDLFKNMFNLSINNFVNVMKFNNIIFIGVDNKNIGETNKYLLYYLFLKCIIKRET